MTSKNTWYYGSPEPPPEQRCLKAGPLTMDYENGDLRGVRLGGREIVQRIYIAVRDRDWGTVANQISDERVEAGDEWFRISYHVENCRDEIHFRWDAEITGNGDGTIRFSFHGKAVTSFLQSRIGFCILHPMLECAGQHCRIERADGPDVDGVFPVYIAVGQPIEPFSEMTAMSYPAGEKVMVELKFSGDLFETEDQRNWTDASYKTFCTPLHLGYPHLIEAGATVGQSLTLRLIGAPRLAPSAAVSDDTVSIFVGESSTTGLPDIGLCAPSQDIPYREEDLRRLRALGLSHLRLDVKPAQPGWQARLDRNLERHRALGVPLEVALHLSEKPEAELEEIAGMIRAAGVSVRRWIVFHAREIVPPNELIVLARSKLASPSGIPVGSGTDCDFFELNCRRPAHEASDFLIYSLNPQTHAFDNASLVETLPVQALTARTARRFWRHRPIHVGPVTLRMRFNLYAAAPAVVGPGALPPEVDPRQMSLFCAAWTLGSIKYLSGCGEVAGLTYYETTGWQGVMETEKGSPCELFPSLPAAVFPVYHLLFATAGFKGGEVLQATSAAPRAVDAMALRKNGCIRILLANMSAEPRRVRLDGVAGRLSCRLVDENSVPDCLQKPEDFWSGPGFVLGNPELELLPFALAILDAA